MPIPKALILDRDGTLITHVPYLHDPAKVALLPGVREGLSTALTAGMLLFLHTNQSGVGRGYFPIESVYLCNQRLVELLNIGAEPFTRICIAPEAPEQTSKYRKPSPEFAKEIMYDYGFANDEIWYLGDRGSDLATARAAGVCGVGVASGLNDLATELLEAGLSAFPVFPRFDSAVNYLLRKK
jgi:D-glycero-D-manno-heptose 1,7-bisphosphate phosphatase